MKKKMTALVIASILAVMTPMAATSTVAQNRYLERKDSRYSREYKARNDQRRRSYNERYYDERYDDGYYNGEYRQPNVYDRHRKAMNLGIGAAAGAIIGGLIGGKKGALIGAGVGVAGGAIVTAKQKPRNYPRY